MSEQKPSPRKAKKLVLEEAVNTLGAVAFEGTFSKRYDHLDIIGAGGMGFVFKGKHKTLRRVEALKVPKPNLLSEPTFLARFKEEASTLAQLQHKNIVHIHHVEIEDDPKKLTYISMEFVSGERLDDFLLSHGSEIRVSEMVSIFLNVAKAIDYFHSQNVIHRDIKPENILIETETMNPKIVDFGLARTEDRDINITAEGGSAGYTLAYASPEQLSNEDVGIATDIYSFAITIYRCLSREYPYNFTSHMGSVIRAHLIQDPIPINERNSNLPWELNHAILPGLSKKPENRPQSATIMVERVGEALRPFLHQRLSDFYEFTGQRNFKKLFDAQTMSASEPSHKSETITAKKKSSVPETHVSPVPPAPKVSLPEVQPTKEEPKKLSPAPQVKKPEPLPQPHDQKKKRGIFWRLVNLILLFLIIGLCVFAGALFLDYKNPEGPTWSQEWIKKALVAIDREDLIPKPNCDPSFALSGTLLQIKREGDALDLAIEAGAECNWEVALNFPPESEVRWASLIPPAETAVAVDQGIQNYSGTGNATIQLLVAENTGTMWRETTLLLKSQEGSIVARKTVKQPSAKIAPHLVEAEKAGNAQSPSETRGAPKLTLGKTSSLKIAESGGTAEVLLENLNISNLNLTPEITLKKATQLSDTEVSALLEFAPNWEWVERKISLSIEGQRLTFTQKPLPQLKMKAEGLSSHQNNFFLQSPASGGSWELAILHNIEAPKVPKNLPTWLQLNLVSETGNSSVYLLTVSPAQATDRNDQVELSLVPGSPQRLFVARVRTECVWQVVESSGFDTRNQNDSRPALVIINDPSCPNASPNSPTLIVDSGPQGWITPAQTQWEKRPKGYAFSWNIAENTSSEPRQATIKIEGTAINLTLRQKGN